MAVDSANTLVRRLRGVAGLLEPGPTDGQLLARFATARDEAAFAELVRRHGPMVLGVCRRVAGESEADDAFQATFIVLARKARTLADQSALGAWLHGVAYRAALKARAVTRKRRAKEAAAARPEGIEMAAPSDVLAVIEQELSRLPNRYREPLVLCGLCGRSRKEVASELGVPEGTLASRLAKARETLAERLRRRGLVVPAAVAGVTAVPAPLADAAVRAATGPTPAAAGRIASEVTKAMFLNKLRTTMLLLAAGAVACAAGWLALARAATNAPLPAAPVPEVAEKPEDGVYLLKFEGEGRKVTLTDGTEAILGKQLSKSIGRGVSLQSWTNDNTRFNLGVKRLGPLPKEVTEVQTALVVSGVVLHIGRPEQLNDDGTADVGANVDSADAAKTLAAAYKIEPQLRKHPGHRYEVRWTPDRKRYEVGDAVKLTMEIKNTGTGPLRFTHGGQQRGARDNQFRFVAQEGFAGKGLPDTGEPENFGGKVRVVTLKPGEIYTADVELTKWFKFTEPNSYRITGVFEMPVIDPLSEKFGPVIWDDLAVGECAVRVVAKK
jgi:RNA polymerase sigma factor (sigma-70 family)